MTIRKANTDDLPRILELRDLARGIMRQDGNPQQWPVGYPTDETFRRDIEQGHSYVIEDDARLIATWAFIPGPDPTYSAIYDGAWLDDTRPYHVIHRIASTPDSHGVMDALLRFCFSQADCPAGGCLPCKNIRIDTHRDNHIMRRALLRHGFTYCGIIHIANGDQRLAYQKLVNNTQLLYTVGHSNQSQEDFLAQVQKYHINCIVDVRSIPVSKYAPQFNQDNIKVFLEHHKIHYLHFGNEFGARRTDCIDNSGQVNFELAIKTPAFRRGVERIQQGLQRGFHVALMCSEANPLECHRFSLISRFFHEHGLDVCHILKDGSVATHSAMEREMIDEMLHARNHLLPEIDQLFGTYTLEDQRRDAYRVKNKEIGYRPHSDTGID